MKNFISIDIVVNKIKNNGSNLLYRIGSFQMPTIGISEMVIDWNLWNEVG